MGKIKSHTPKLTKKFYPFVSICTPTFNRRPFIPIMFECFKNQTYPKNRMEWIIVDDGTDCIRDLIEQSGIEQIKYFREEKQMNLGEKRNYMHTKIKGTIVVYMDDDDYYPPERVSHAVDKLTENREALCAGSSELYVYFKHIDKMYQSGPYGPNHSTAGTFAFRTELLKDHKYENHAALAEEKYFLKNYTVPFVQLDPLKTILVFSHEHNTFDKRKLLENQNDYFKPSDKTIEQFIKNDFESSIKQFFTTDVHQLLLTYSPGEPSMKPEVLKQITEIDEERRKMNESHLQGQGGIIINEPGKPPRQLTAQETAVHMNNYINQINSLIEKNKSLEMMVSNLQKRIAQPEVSTIKEDDSNIENIPPSQEEKTFVYTLLNRITELENTNKSLKEQIEMIEKIQSVAEKPKETEPKESKEPKEPKEEVVFKMKSKTTPEVCIEI